MNSNLFALERRSRTLANRLREIYPETSLKLIKAGSGDWTAKYDYPDGSYRFIHSRIDPRQEARTWTESQYIIMPRLVIIGVGLAYHVFELLKICRNIESAYLIEADESIFQLAMRVHDLTSLIQNTSIYFHIGSPLSDIENDLVTTFVQPFSFHIFSPIASLCPDSYNPLRKSIEKHLCALRLKEQGGETPDRLFFAEGVANLLKQMSTT